MRHYSFYVYILTNPSKSTLYIGVTNNLSRRMLEHKGNRGLKKTFAGRHYCYKLVYFEHYQYVLDAIAREKQLKKWSRAKKDKLISDFNEGWKSLNGQFFIE